MIDYCYYLNPSKSEFLTHSFATTIHFTVSQLSDTDLFSRIAQELVAKITAEAEACACNAIWDLNWQPLDKIDPRLHVSLKSKLDAKYPISKYDERELLLIDRITGEV